MAQVWRALAATDDRTNWVFVGRHRWSQVHAENVAEATGEAEICHAELHPLAHRVALVPDLHGLAREAAVRDDHDERSGGPQAPRSRAKDIDRSSQILDRDGEHSAIE